MKYFAYGSNMLRERLRERVPSATVLSPAELPGYSLRFNKLSKDGSAKANIVDSENPADVVYGVLYEVDESEKRRLDLAEGLGNGYVLARVAVRTPWGDEGAFTYVAAPEALRDDLKPFTWYKDMVLAGARQNNLPPHYVRAIEDVPTSDPIGRDVTADGKAPAHA